MDAINCCVCKKARYVIFMDEVFCYECYNSLRHELKFSSEVVNFIIKKLRREWRENK